jgi:hypothetical protein
MGSMQCNVEFEYQHRFAPGPGKNTESLERVGRSQILRDANWLLASSPALNTRALTLVPICARFFFCFVFLFPHNLFFLQIFFIIFLWFILYYFYDLDKQQQCITPAEGMNAYMNKYAYICNYDSLIIGKFGSLLSFGKIGCYTRFVAHPITKIMFDSWDQTRQLNCNFHYEYTTAKLVPSCLFHYKNTFHDILLHFSLVYLTSTCHFTSTCM